MYPQQDFECFISDYFLTFQVTKSRSSFTGPSPEVVRGNGEVITNILQVLDGRVFRLFFSKNLGRNISKLMRYIEQGLVKLLISGSIICFFPTLLFPRSHNQMANYTEL